MKTFLRVVTIVVALFVGIVLAGIVYFAPPTLYGLRPHAVKPDLDAHDVGELLSLAENGRTTGVLVYDAWYAGRNGQSGWFAMPLEGARKIQFGVNGALDPEISKVFGAAPRRCNGTGLPEKMIRVIEPDRTATGFLGRSTCRRAAMDLSAIIAASTPVMRTTAQMTHAELAAFDADPANIRDNVDEWPTPFAYYRTLTLPLIWYDSGISGSDPFFSLRRRAEELVKAATIETKIDVQLRIKDWYPRQFEGITTNQLPLQTQTETVFISGIKVRRMDLAVLCAADTVEACDQIDATALLPDVAALRDPHVLSRARATAQPLPDGITAIRDVLRESTLTRDTLVAPTAQKRRFSVTWYQPDSQ